MKMGPSDGLECPSCDLSGVTINLTTVEIPYFGEVILSTMLCPNCGMRSTEVYPVKEREPARYILKVRSTIDLDVRVVRSSSSRLSIPEIGLVVEPGPSLEGHITNVEGIFLRLLEVVRTMERDLGDDIERLDKARALIELLERFVTGRMEEGESLTLVLEDPKGNGIMAASDGRVLKEPLNILEDQRSGP